MNKGTFRLDSYDEGGLKGNLDALRLVCNIEDGGKLVLWGKYGATQNIDIVLKAGLPCTIECYYQSPNEIHAQKYGHTHWVREDYDVKVIE